MKSLSLSKPHLVVVVGIPGAGKSFFANKFSETFHAPLVSTDELKKYVASDSDTGGPKNNKLKDLAELMLVELLKAKRTIVYDGLLSTRKDRQDIVSIAKKAGFQPLFVWVQTEPGSAKQRATRKSAGKSAITAEQFDAELAKFSDLKRDENYVVISGKHTFATQLKIVLRRLVESRIGTPESTTQILPRPSVRSRYLR